MVEGGEFTGGEGHGVHQIGQPGIVQPWGLRAPRSISSRGSHLPRRISIQPGHRAVPRSTPKFLRPTETRRSLIGPARSVIPPVLRTSTRAQIRSRPPCIVAGPLDHVHTIEPDCPSRGSRVKGALRASQRDRRPADPGLGRRSQGPAAMRKMAADQDSRFRLGLAAVHREAWSVMP
jgi:hypothetical protein